MRGLGGRTVESSRFLNQLLKIDIGPKPRGDKGYESDIMVRTFLGC